MPLPQAGDLGGRWARGAEAAAGRRHHRPVCVGGASQLLKAAPELPGLPATLSCPLCCRSTAGAQGGPPAISRPLSAPGLQVHGGHALSLRSDRSFLSGPWYSQVGAHGVCVAHTALGALPAPRHGAQPKLAGWCSSWALSSFPAACPVRCSGDTGLLVPALQRKPIVGSGTGRLPGGGSWAWVREGASPGLVLVVHPCPGCRVASGLPRVG